LHPQQGQRIAQLKRELRKNSRKGHHALRTFDLVAGPDGGDKKASVGSPPVEARDSVLRSNKRLMVSEPLDQSGDVDRNRSRERTSSRAIALARIRQRISGLLPDISIIIIIIVTNEPTSQRVNE